MHLKAQEESKILPNRILIINVCLIYDFFMAGCFDFVQFFTGDKCTKYYKLGKTIGKGSYGAVKDSMDRRTHTFWAVKCINKQHLSHQDEDQVKTELKVLQMVNHENIVQFREAFNCHTTHYLVFERLDGGELFNRIVERTTHTELDAREIVRPLVNALAYLHSLNIVHGDIKPENLLFTTKDDKAPLKIIDFGSARVLSEGEVSVKPTTAGTHVYSSPELREGSLYNQSADIWSLGIITYIVLCGFHPFPKKRDIIHEVGFPSPYWDTVSKPGM